MAKKRSNAEPLVSIQDSEMPRLLKSKLIEPVKTQQQVVVTLHLRNREQLPDEQEEHDRLPHQCEQLSQDQCALRHGADEQDIELVCDFAQRQGWKVEGVHGAAGMVQLRGNAEQVESTFGVQLCKCNDATGDFMGHESVVHVPRVLSDVVTGVTGLDSRSTLPRIAPEEPHYEHFLENEIPDWIQTYFPGEIAELYEFPRNVDGSGQTIGIVSFGGNFDPKDLEAYFKVQKLDVPEISIVDVDKKGFAASPRTRKKKSIADDFELTMDLEVAGSVAPGAHLVVYRVSRWTSQPYLNVVKYAIHDPQYQPSILSISYGMAEGLMRQQDMRLANQAFQQATRMGITICVASGDAGSATRDYNKFPPPPTTHVNFPANCPFVLACGGCSLETEDGRIVREAVWNHLHQCRASSSGGFSRVFKRPRYQQNIQFASDASFPQGFQGRGVPDVAANAAVTTGIKSLVRGKWLPGGGTSATAPLWAALIARLNQALGRRLGHINPALYRIGGTDVFQDITDGFNGAYQACEGWDPCTGLGRPHGTKLLEALQAFQDSDTFPVIIGQDDLLGRAKYLDGIARKYQQEGCRLAPDLWVAR